MDILGFFHMVGMNAWFYGAIFILVLSTLVFIHEMGHYLVARWCGVRVEVFSIGFGKELWGVNDSHGTRWKISLIPLGGYVKLFGDVDPASAKHIDTFRDEKTGQVMHRDTESGEVFPFTEKDRDDAFFAKPVWKRAAVVFAGPAINYLFAIIILTGIFSFNGQPITPPSAAAVIAGSAADRAGFEAHDLVLEIDNTSITDFDDIRRAMMIGLDTQRHFKVQRGEEVVDIYAKPDLVTNTDHFGFKHTRGLLGLASPQQAILIKDIRKINTQTFSEDTLVGDIRAVILENMGQPMRIQIAGRGDEEGEVYIVRPQANQNEALNTPDAEGYDYLVLASVEQSRFVRYNPVKALGVAVIEAKDITLGTLEALGQMIMGTRPATELGGIIRIGALAGDMAKQGVVALILFSALLSINLGLINLLPIPLLDGGHLLFYAFEAILRRPVPDKVQEYAFRGGMAFLVAIMVFANLNDIVQLIL